MMHEYTPAEVRATRTTAGLSQGAAAALVGLKRWQTWQDWELGISPPDHVRVTIFRHLTGIERIPFPRKRRGTGTAGKK